MLKKIGIIFLIIIFAVLALLYWQKDRIEKNLANALAEHQFKVEKVELNFFPISLKLNNVDYFWQQQQRILRAETVRLNLAALDLLFAKLNVKQVEVKQASIHQLNQKDAEFEQLEISLFPQHSALSIFNLTAVNINEFMQTQPHFDVVINGQNKQKIKFNLKTQFTLNLNTILFSQFASKIDLVEPLINPKQVNLNFAKGKLLFDADQYDFIGKSVEFNQLLFEQIKVKTKAKQAKIMLDDKIYIQLEPRNEHNYAQVNAQNLTLSEWLNAFNLPLFVDGKTALRAKLILEKHKLKSADVNLNIQNGKINNLNLLDLIKPYLPISYNKSANRSETKFAQLISKFTLQDQLIEVSQLDLDHKYLHIKGRGQINSANNQCDLHTKFQPKISGKIILDLPIRLFGNCSALEHKMENKGSYQDQLKELIKQRFIGK